MRIARLLGLLCIGCTGFPELPEVREPATPPGPIVSEGKAVERRYPVSDLIDAHSEGSEEPRKALDALAKLVKAALGDAGVSGAAADPEREEVILQVAPSAGEKAEALLASLRSERKRAMRIEVRAIDADPRGLRGWDVFFWPLSLLPGGTGGAACAIVQNADLDRWLEAALPAEAARVVRFPATSAFPLRESRLDVACQLAYLSHFEKKEAGGAQILDPVMASLAHGFSAAIRAIPLADGEGVCARFDILLRKPAKGVGCALLRMKRMSIHVPNILEKRVSGTVRIPQGTCAVVALGSLGCWGSDPEPAGEGWITFVVLRLVPATGK